MYKLQFTLKQHTPLIHFQHDQTGATLRATEVKPKLDRFILLRLGNGNYEQGKHIALNNGWLVGNGEKPALDYKMRIEVKGETSKYFITSNPPSIKNDNDRQDLILDVFGGRYLNQTQYFGNNKNLKPKKIEEIEEVKLGVLCLGSVQVQIQTFNYDLFLYFQEEKVGNTCFVLNNFGTRQTKGFGCFLPENITEAEVKQLLAKDSNVLGVFKKNTTSSFVSKLQTIANDYSLLKRGKSHDGYQKSKLWEYLCATQQVKWEKHKIKTHLIANNKALFDSLKCDTPHRIDDCKTMEDTTNHKYVRALLGLAEQYEFVKSVGNERLTVKVSDASPDDYRIERYKSPIRYIVSENAIYLVAYKINPLLQEYTDNTGTVKKRNINFQINGVPDFQLQIPKNFDLLDFLTKKSGYLKL